MSIILLSIVNGSPCILQASRYVQIEPPLVGYECGQAGRLYNLPYDEWSIV
ncbi:MAG: hypothetical protein ACOYME_00540 [Prochlorotrichaceae cyanobacterium]